MYALGYDYVLSKRTRCYVAYNKIDNGVITNANGSFAAGSSYYYIAGPAAKPERQLRRSCAGTT